QLRLEKVDVTNIEQIAQFAATLPVPRSPEPKELQSIHTEEQLRNFLLQCGIAFVEPIDSAEFPVIPSKEELMQYRIEPNVAINIANLGRDHRVYLTQGVLLLDGFEN